MKINIIQSAVLWEDPIANREIFGDKILDSEKADLIILPEMFTTGFSMNPEKLAEPMDGPTVLWLKELAKHAGAAITGSVIMTENGAYFNRLLFVLPSGELFHYDKRHLFSLAGEDKVYTRGNKKLIVDYLGWKIAPFVCYDLRFPVFSRNTEQYDLAIYVANWPETRINAWDTLLKARAIENMAFVAAVNRIGSDYSKLNYPGHSQIIDPLGSGVIDAGSTEGVFSATIDKQMLIETRAKLAFLEDRDDFTVN